MRCSILELDHNVLQHLAVFVALKKTYAARPKRPLTHYDAASHSSIGIMYMNPPTQPSSQSGWERQFHIWR